jgi:hypothetical protein
VITKCLSNTAITSNCSGFTKVRPHPATNEEIREDRFLNMLWPQIGEIHDLNFGPAHGTFFTAQRPLTLEDRFEKKQKRKKKKP